MDRVSRLRSSLRLSASELVVITERGGGSRIWGVVGKHPEGWTLAPLDDGAAPRLFLHDEIFTSYVEGRMKVLGRPTRTLDAEEELRVRRAWEGAPPEMRAIAERRYLILRACQESRSRFRSMGECFRSVPAEVVDRMAPIWEKENRDLRPATTAAMPADVEGPLASVDRLSPRWVPCERSIWNYYERCGNGQPDIRKLLPRDHLKGDSRPLFGSEILDLMDEIIRDEVLKPPPKTAVMAYGLFSKRAEERLGIKPPLLPGEILAGSVTVEVPAEGVGAPEAAAEGACRDGGGRRGPRRMNELPSYTTFTRRISKVRADEKVKGHGGARKMRLEFGTFDEARPSPFLLNQVEVDHSFINMFVKDDETGRLLGRPWLTAIRDRRTKVILGLHVSFLPPSWMTLSRAIAHAIWPKDLSGHPGLDHGWDYHGVFDWLVTDRGLEFLGDGLRLSGRIIGFEIGSLQGFSPWLKGGLERLFKTMKLQIFSYREGTSAWRALKHYDGRAKTQMTFGELKAELLRWVVDRYHFTDHGGIGMCPDSRWQMELETHGPPRPVGEFADLRRLFSKTEPRSIQNGGIEVDGLLYNSELLAELRGRGGSNKWDVMFDPFDLRSIFLHDPQAGATQDSWLEIGCTRPDLSVNVTQHQHNLHKMLARMTAPGEVITENMLLAAKDRAERYLLDEVGKRRTTGTAARYARYRDDGTFLTPVTLMGVQPALEIVRSVDWGRPEFDPVTGLPLIGGSPSDAAPTPALDDGAKPADIAPDAPHPPNEQDYESAILEALSELKEI